MKNTSQVENQNNKSLQVEQTSEEEANLVEGLALYFVLLARSLESSRQKIINTEPEKVL